MPLRHQPNRRQFLATAGVLASGITLSGYGQTPGSGTRAGPWPFALGLASYTTRKLSLDETVAMTQRLAMDTLCLKAFHLPLDATDETLRATGAKVREAGLDLYGGGVITMRTVGEAENAFRYARAAGMRTIVGVPMPDVLPRVNELVAEHDIAVAIHNHGPGDNVYPTPASAYERIKDLDPRIGLCMDVGHTARIGEDPVADVVRFADRLLDLHVKDVSRAAPEGKTVEIGRGVLDIPALMKALLRTGYARVISFEYEKDADDPLPGLAESVGYVRGVLAVIT